jgi:hypothetical protein
MLASPGSSLAALTRLATPGQQQNQVKIICFRAIFASCDCDSDCDCDCAVACSPYSVHLFGRVLRHRQHPGHARGSIQGRATRPRDGMSTMTMTVFISTHLTSASHLCEAAGRPCYTVYLRCSAQSFEIACTFVSPAPSATRTGSVNEESSAKTTGERARA